MEAMVEAAREAFEEFWFPPTAEQLLRRERRKLATKGRNFERLTKQASDEAAVMKRRLRAAAHVEDESTLRGMAREVARKQCTAAKMENARRLMSNTEGHLVAAEASSAVRVAMRRATAALGTATEGGVGALAMEAQDMQRQIMQAEMQEGAMADALADEGDDVDIETTVNELVDEARAAIVDNMPRPPDSTQGVLASTPAPAPAPVTAPEPVEEEESPLDEELERRLEALRR